MVLPVGGLLKAVALAPLVLFLPGYAVTAAMFPSASLARSERLVYSIAFSVGAASLGGLVWQLAFGLNRLAWALLLVAIVLASCAVAQRRREALGTAEEARAEPGLPRLDPPTAIAVLAAIAIAIVAVVTAIDGVEEQRAESHFSALWVVPGSATTETVEVGIWNHQGEVHEYRLEVEGNGRTIRRWEGRLGSRKHKQLILQHAAIPARARLVVSLYRDGALYRRTELQTGIEA